MIDNRITIYTIGHSTHPIERFIEHLLANQIEAIADVRSSPFSRFNPQFNRDLLRDSLASQNIKYVFLGKELGARSTDMSCYKNRKVQYSLLARTDSFRAGIERVLDGARSLRIALMCSERDPLECHRTILVARDLVAHGAEVLHILHDGSVESHPCAIARLRRHHGLEEPDMFSSEEDLSEEAYTRQAAKIAYVMEDAPSVRG